MLNLSNVAKLAANQLASDGAWLVLLEIDLGTLGIIRVVRNTEDIIWKGEQWSAFPFELDPVSHNREGELSTVNVRVCNIDRVLQYYLERDKGAVDRTVTLYVVHSKNLGFPVPEMEEEFTIQKTSYDAEWVTFCLGGPGNMMRREPMMRILKDWCPFKYKGPQCKYRGSLATCRNTLNDCKAHGNQARFGGEPSIPTSGLYGS